MSDDDVDHDFGTLDRPGWVWCDECDEWHFLGEGDPDDLA